MGDLAGQKPYNRLFLDCESVPGPEALANLDRIAAKAHAEDEAAALGYCSLHPALCRIVTVAFRWNDEPTQAVFGFEAESEAWLLRAVLAEISRCDEFVTFGGTAFDVPALAHRARINGVSLPAKLAYAASQQKPWERAPHYDLCQQMRLGGRMFSLETYAIAYGVENSKELLPGGGGGVLDAVRAGLTAEVVEYCKGDVDTLAAIYSKFTRRT